ncbi:MAG: hypothetical protein M3015_02330 [Bacteroidota bacterium]|nr:hypothetical protein [Bacteroidota bacterium]
MGDKLAIERLLEKNAKEYSFVVVSQNGKVVKHYPKTSTHSALVIKENDE